MAIFTPCIRIKRKDGLYQVYIRVCHRGGVQYIKTGHLTNDKGLKVSFDQHGKEQIEIKDRLILKDCYSLISIYTEKINRNKANNFDCKSLVQLLEDKNTELSFTGYAQSYANNIYNQNRDSSYNSYKMALSSLHKFFGKENIAFTDMTSKRIRKWIESMSESSRKKELYPTCIRAIFNSAIREYNDYDLNIIKITTNPFIQVSIPKAKKAEKRSISPTVLLRLLCSTVTLPEYEGISRKELAQDVSVIIFCLAGINAADLYDMEKSALKEDWKLCYNRKKTREKSESGAYMEIVVPEIIRPLLHKYKGSKNKLFVFNERFADSASFVKTIDKGLNRICEELKIEDKVTTYSLRHTWATIAKNDCEASTEEVGFALVHSSAHKITEGYIRRVYTPVDRLNNKVLHFAFVETLLNYIPGFSLLGHDFRMSPPAR